MGDCTSKAEFTGPAMGSNRKDVVVSSKMGGGGLLASGTETDVETYGEDAAGKKSATKNADSVKASGMQYDAKVHHGANWEKTYIRVKCADKTWSNWLQVKK